VQEFTLREVTQNSPRFGEIPLAQLGVFQDVVH
jgi:hypothetical protein